MKPIVYLAGPMTGLLVRDAGAWRVEAQKYLKRKNILIASPMRGKLNFKDVIKPVYDSILSNSKAIVTRDYYDIKRSDALLVNLLHDNDCLSVGTIAEMAWAYTMHKPVIVASNPASQYREHPFLIMFTRFETNNLKDALETVVSVVGG